MDVTLPDLGESIREAEVLKVLVREGDAVAADQPLSWRPTRPRSSCPLRRRGR